ncbi:hypothetical protein BGZ82_010885 [Podila clonocystis]|nr:hypothetical protein BGZ82_010885 [Podila clonocystis]
MFVLRRSSRHLYVSSKYSASCSLVISDSAPGKVIERYFMSRVEYFLQRYGSIAGAPLHHRLKHLGITVVDRICNIKAKILIFGIRSKTRLDLILGIRSKPQLKALKIDCKIPIAFSSASKVPRIV